MRLQHLHLMLAIAQTGSLRASALALNVSQPALTKALHQLEDEFGCVLVQRSAKGARLAPAGELLATRAAAALREIERGREEIAWHQRHVEARVTVGLSPASAILLAPGAVARFGGRWPQVRLCVVDTLYPRALAQVRAGEIDLAIGPLPVEGVGRDLIVQPVFDSQNVIGARRSHPLSRARRLADLSDAAWVLTGPAGGPGDPMSLGQKAPKIRLECQSFTTLLALMPTLDVVGIMPRGFFDRYGPLLQLTTLPIEDTLPRLTIHVVSRGDAPLTLPAQRLVDAFVQEAGGLSAGPHALRGSKSKRG